MPVPATASALRLSRLRGAVMLAGEAVDHLTARVHEFHRAISDLPFGVVGAVPLVQAGSQPVRVVHDSVTDGVYGAIRNTAQVLFGTAASALQAVERSSLAESLPAPSPAMPAAPSRLQDDVVAALSGAVGDRMAARRNPLAIRFGVYQHGQRLRLDPAGVAAAFPRATPRIAVFLHGLCGNENVWQMFHQPGDAQTDPYGERLARDLGYTPVYLRYNSGLHISHNGRLLSRTLDKLLAAWPLAVDDLVLVGHSMGGLVARAGAEAARRHDARWLEALSQILCLGSPHLGAPLEKAVHLATNLMKRLPLSRPVANLLDARSLGIKDLRWGYTTDDEWRGRDPDAFWTADRQQYAPLPGVRYRFLGTCIHEDPEHPVSRAIGDGLVRVPSSLALDIAGADGALRSALHHLRLLNHPDIYAQVRSWIGDSRVGGSGVGG